LLNFYGNTCVPCRAETPWLVEFEKQYKDKGLQIVGVEMYGSSAPSIQKFAGEFGVDYPLLIGSDTVGDLYTVGGLPTNYYINGKGTIVHATEGAMPKADMEAFIQQALQ
jgi:thiol-disulfide isomerase/thioredoxin